MEKTQLKDQVNNVDFFFDNSDDKVVSDIRLRHNLVHLLEGDYSFNSTNKGGCLVYEGKTSYDSVLFSYDCPDNYVIFFKKNKFKFNKDHSDEVNKALRIYSSVEILQLSSIDIICFEGQNYNVNTIEKLINNSKIHRLNSLTGFNLLKEINHHPVYNSVKNKSFLNLIKKIN